MNPDLSLIMVNYFSEPDLENCLNSLKKYHPGLNYHLVVIDNGSTGDNLQQALNRVGSGVNVQVIRNEENVGFAAACNRGMKLSQGEFVLFLNPDILFVGDSIGSMMQFLKEHPDTGAVGCRQILSSGKYYVGHAGYHPSLGTAFNHTFFLSRFFPELFKGVYWVRDAKGKNPINVDWVSGGCLLVRKEVIDQTGGMDDSFFLYSEDVEWCARIRKEGWKIYYLPFTQLIHHRSGGQSNGPEPALWLRNQVQLYRRTHGPLPAFLFRLVTVLGLLIRSGIYLVHYLALGQREDKNQARRLFQAGSIDLHRRR